MTYYDRLRKQEETKQLELDYALERGEQQGIAKGEKRGIAKGKFESSKQTAKRLLETTDFSFDRVAELTSLTVQQVKQI